MDARTIRTKERTGRARLVLAVVVALVSTACIAPPAGSPDTTVAAPVVDAPAPAPGPAAAPLIEQWRAEMLASLNAQRAATGAGPLADCGTLDMAAQRHSEDQAAHTTMSHTGSDGSSPWDRMARAGYTGWNVVAENVAYGYPTVGDVMAGWMASTGHRTNILNPSVTQVGTGRATGPDGRPYWTQDFGAGGTC